MKILIVDDDVELAGLLTEILLAHEYEASAVFNGTEGLERITADPPDVALLDINMPGIDGISLCKEIRSNDRFRAMKIIMLTFSDVPSDIAKAVSAGADAYINKGTKAAVIVARIEDLVRLQKPPEGVNT